ncbi:MAG: ferrochelatase [Acidobacteria bacterium]|nr:ferrochelatase [Acidobacteriota bacterium]MBI3655254.1 ferrochelatase [Acidobacteriota bacterium]
MTAPTVASENAVLLMAYGGPTNLDEVEPYLADVTGRKLPPALVAEIKERYRLIGGKSPLLEITQAQSEALAKRLEQIGSAVTVFIGMRHWQPYIQETVEQMAARPIRKVVALCLSPYYSSASIGAYAKKLHEAVGETGVAWEIALVASYHDHPLLLQAFAEKLKGALDRYTPAERAAVQVIFSAHSLPERLLKTGDPYDRQLRETIAGIMRLVGPLSWHFAYQSQGRTDEPWMGPRVEAVLADLHAAGHRHVLMAPIGFLADHVEILYDVDVLFQSVAKAKGMRLDRIESLNVSPRLIEALADLIVARLKP